VDTEKYVGDMMRIDILPDDRLDGEYSHFTINMTSMTAKSPTGEDTLTSEGYPIPVVLDSGTTLSFLPADLVVQIWEEAGVEFNDILKEGLLPCSRRNSPGLFRFGFGGPDGPKIEVPMDELVLDLTLGGAPSFPGGSQYKGQDACLFGIQPFTDAPYILGDTFLRSSYVVYDLVNNQIGLAQTDFNETGSNIVVFEKNGSTIPMSTIAPNQGKLDTPAEIKDPAYIARNGFQSGAWMLRVFQASTWLAITVAFLLLI
jgi:elongation factor G